MNWNRKQEWDDRRRRRAQHEPREHYTTCKTQCDEPLELINIIDADPEYECAHGHVSHCCNCAEISRAFWEAAAESSPAL